MYGAESTLRWTARARTEARSAGSMRSATRCICGARCCMAARTQPQDVRDEGVGRAGGDMAGVRHGGMALGLLSWAAFAQAPKFVTIPAGGPGERRGSGSTTGSRVLQLYRREAADSRYLWYRANSGGRSHAVGKKRPNAWGLYDVEGNVWEWTAGGEATAKRRGPTSRFPRVSGIERPSCARLWTLDIFV